ncbi:MULTISPECIES: hypothetical protein [Rhodobacterales]|nr:MULTISPECIES: hypothetical protein [Paracoccaceae]
MSMPRPVLLNDGLGPRTPPGQSTDTKGRPRGRSTRPEEALHHVA